MFSTGTLNFRPTVLPSCIFWVDAWPSNGATYNGSNQVSQLNDWSASANHPVQAVDVTKPIWTVGAKNGKTALVTSSTQSLGMTSLALTGNFTLYIANYTSSTTGTGVLLGTNSSLNTIKIGRTTTTSIVRLVNAGTADTGLTYPSVGTANVFTLSRNASNKVDGAFNGSTYTRLFSDAAQAGTVDLASMFWADIVSGQTWNGGIMEVIVYTTIHTTAQRSLVENYLCRKWGIIHV